MESFPILWDQVDGKVLVIDIARPEDAEEVNSFLDVHFVLKTPVRQLSSFDKRSKECELKQQQDELNWIQDRLKHGYSLTVRDASTGQLVAVQVNDLEERKLNAEEEDDEPHPMLIRSLFHTFNKEVDLFKMYETNRIMHLCMVSVDEEYGRRGIAAKLNELSVDLAVASGAGAIKVEAVSEFAARVIMKLGFSVIKSIDYATFEINGATPLASVPELVHQHPTARLMARRVP